MISAPMGLFAAILPANYLGIGIPVAGLDTGVGLLSLQVSFLPPWILGLVPLTLFLAILFAPLEYALGALACSFLAACTVGLADVFQSARWYFLLLAAVTFSFRFFLRLRASRWGASRQFLYLMLMFWLFSAATIVTTVNLTFTVLKLGALTCLFYVAARSAAHVVEVYGPAAPRRFLYGLLTYSAAFILVAAPSYLLSSGFSTYGHRFYGYLGHPNAWGAFVAFSLPWMACPLFQRSRHFTVSRLALTLAALVVTYTMLLSGSRAALVGALIALATLSLIHADRRVAATVLLATFVVSVEAVAKPDLVPNLVRQYLYKYKGRDQVDMFRSRTGPWEISKRTFLRNPWMGLGFGVTSRAEAQWLLDVRSVKAMETGSSVWSALSQVGLLGSVPLFLAISLLLLRAGRFAWKVKDIWLTAIYASTLALVTNACLEGWLLAPGSFPCTYFWIQCFFLNAMMSRFQPAPVQVAPFPLAPAAESLTPVGR